MFSILSTSTADACDLDFIINRILKFHISRVDKRVQFLELEVMYLTVKPQEISLSQLCLLELEGFIKTNPRRLSAWSRLKD